jgi:hypothetical protein
MRSRQNVQTVRLKKAAARCLKETRAPEDADPDAFRLKEANHL